VETSHIAMSARKSRWPRKPTSERKREAGAVRPRPLRYLRRDAA
jgi:hypothetical protein